MEVEISYLLDLPQLLSVMNSDELEWQSGNVIFKDNGIWFPSEDGWETIPLQAIGIIGRDLPESFISKMHGATGHPSEFAVDYSKKTTFGSTYLVSTIVFAGSKEDIFKVKTFLEKQLGYTSSNEDPLLKEGYLQLVSLLASGIKDEKYLLSIFKDDSSKLNIALSDLKTMGMLDEENTPTKEGIKNLNNFKNVDAEEKDAEISKLADNNLPAFDSSPSFDKDSVGITLNYGKSIIRSVIKEDELAAFLPSGEIKTLKLRKEGIFILDILAVSGLKIEIFARKYVVVALYIALSRKMDIYDRILALSFTKIADPSIFSGMLETERENVQSCIGKLKHFGYLGENGHIEPKGLDRLKGQFKNIDLVQQDFVEEEVETKMIFERLTKNGHLRVEDVEEQFSKAPAQSNSISYDPINEENERKRMLDQIGGL